MGLRSVRLFVLDMDGTVSLGDRPIPGALEFLEQVRSSGRFFLFLTNNSSSSGAAYAERFRAMGLDVNAEDVLTSGAATAARLAGEGIKDVYLLGTPSLDREFQAVGMEPRSDKPELVVLGFDKTLTYQRLERACHLLRDGLPYVATHPDINCPTPDGPIPDAGAMIALIEASTGRRPDRIIGKPSPEFLQAAMDLKGVGRTETAMIGDRLYTDIACGLAAGVPAILTLTGETDRTMLKASEIKPDLAVDSLTELIPLMS